MTEPKKVLDVAVNLAVLAFVGFAAFGPTGFFRGGRDARAAEREQRLAIGRLWSELSQGQASETQVLVEFTDFQCPYCRDMRGVVSDLAGEGVTVVTRHLPITVAHPKAESAALAAICADEQGLLPPFADRLYSHDAWHTAPEPWLEEASAAGVTDLPAFTECLTSSRAADRLAQDRELARRLGVRSTPTYVGRGGVHRGIGSRDEIMKIVR